MGTNVGIRIGTNVLVPLLVVLVSSVPSTNAGTNVGTNVGTQYIPLGTAYVLSLHHTPYTVHRIPYTSVVIDEGGNVKVARQGMNVC